MCRIQPEYGSLTDLLNDNNNDYDIRQLGGILAQKGDAEYCTYTKTNATRLNPLQDGQVCSRKSQIGISNYASRIPQSIVDHLVSWASYVLFDFARIRRGRKEREREK